jgi:hypothetical protein
MRLCAIDNQLQRQEAQWQCLDQSIRHQNERINTIENQVQDMHETKKNLTMMGQKVYSLNESMQHHTKQINEYQHSIEVVSELYENINYERSEDSNKITALERQMAHLQSQITEVKDYQNEQNETILDLQCRSMQDNLIFYNIKEPETQGQYENTENTLCEFIKHEMKIDEDINFQRVHRLGKQMINQLKPRPIIAKFREQKQRDLIKFAAPDILKSTNYGVREQFPREIEERRKTLYPKMKEAKDEGQRVKLVRDKLFIENVRYLPDRNTMVQNSNRNSKMNSNNGSAPQRTTQHEYNSTKVYYAKTTNRYNNHSKDKNTIQKTATPISNRFALLSGLEDESNHAKQNNGKRMAKSPIDISIETKKHREFSPSNGADRNTHIHFLDSTDEDDPYNSQTEDITNYQENIQDRDKIDN